MQGDPHADDLARKRAVLMARKAGPPPDVSVSAWTTFMDLFELLNEFAVFLIEVWCDCTLCAEWYCAHVSGHAAWKLPSERV